MMYKPEKYLIVGGSTKCGTTSVFKYFEFHPQICPCKMKESRFFLEESYRLMAKQRDAAKYTSFSELFSGCNNNSVGLEATPDYLYSELAAEKIRNEKGEFKLVFILRDPVDRLQSWYKFARLNGLIDNSLSINQYVKQQFSNPDSSMQHLRSLEQGRYGMYLEKYIETFGRENIHITFYEHLVADPHSFCRDIAAFTGIDPDYFSNYDFKVFNKSVPVKSVAAHRLFRKIKRTVRPVTRMLFPGLQKKLKLAGYKIEQAYTSANTGSDNIEVNMDTTLKKELNHYYAADLILLEKITGKVLPWKI